MSLSTNDGFLDNSNTQYESLKSWDSENAMISDTQNYLKHCMFDVVVVFRLLSLREVTPRQ